MTAAVTDQASGTGLPRPTAPSKPSATEALTGVAAAIDQLLAADLTLPPDTDILHLLRGIETATRRLHTASLTVITQTGQRGLAAPAGATSTANLLRQLLPISAADAAARVRLAAATTPTTGLTGAPIPPQLPRLATALHNGHIGAAQGGTIVSTLNGFPADVPPEIRDSVEQFLVEQAAVLDPKTLHNIARRIALMANPDGPYDERDATEKQQFHIGNRRDDGLTRCWGLFDDITIETLRTALAALCAPTAARTTTTPEPATETDSTDIPDTATARSASDTTPDPVDPIMPDDSADAGTPAPVPAATDTDPDTDTDTDVMPTDHPAPRQPWRASRPPFEWAPLGIVPGDYRYPATHPGESTHHQPPDEPAPPPDLPPAATRRAHALAAILTHYLNSGAAPTIHSEKPHLLITLTEHDLRHTTGSAQLGYGDTIDITTARMLACDAAAIPAVLRGKTEILDIGRAMRTFTAACRKAILLRDIGCTFPGCTMPGTMCDNHHIRHWANGGPSDLDNAALLCRRHHTLIHHGLWTIRLGPHRTPEIIPPATHDSTQRPQHNTVHRPPHFQWPGRQ